MKQLMEFVKLLESESLSNQVKVYFSRKTSNNTVKYITHRPAASSQVQNGILNTMLPYVTKQLSDNKIVNYSPLGVLDGEIEKVSTPQIPLFSDFLCSIAEDKLYFDMSSLKIEKIGFYCVAISCDNKTLYLFRQFQKLKKLRQGFLTRIVENELNVIENDFLGIDEYTDMVAFEDNLFLLNHISLERIFEYRDEFLKKTNEALGELLSQEVVSNIDQFASDCRNDVRIMKRLTNIMTKERLPLFFDNYERVPEIVKELGLDIDFDEDGKLVYRERSQLFHIINLLSDAYFKSLLAQRTGVAKLEGEL